MTLPRKINFDTLKPEEFEEYLPDLFATGDAVAKSARIPASKKFPRRAIPDCAALVHDLETIAETARSLFEPVADPSDQVWTNIQSKLREESRHTGNGEAAQEDEEDLDEVKEIDSALHPAVIPAKRPTNSATDYRPL